MYRGEVEIPPLSMVDDVLFVSDCGFKTSMHCKNGTCIMRSGFYVNVFKLKYKRDHISHIEPRKSPSLEEIWMIYLTDYAITISTNNYIVGNYFSSLF